MRTNKLQHPVQLVFPFLIYVGAVVAIIYFAVCIFLFFQQTRFIFFPSSIIKTTPEFLNLAYKDVWLPVSARAGKVEHIHGWWIQANQPNAKVLLYLHGNAINIGANVVHAHRFYQLGFSVLLIDYRGYGRSKGRFPSESRVYQDAATAWDYLVYQKQISPSQIFIYGHSLGGAIAIDLALKNPNAAGLIVESSFTSLQKVTAHRNNYWMFPVNLILTQRFDSIGKVPNLKIPVLFIHGTDDVVIPAFMSQDLYAAAPEPKTLVLVPGAGHSNVAEVAPSIYLQAVRSFVFPKELMTDSGS
ncbi:alpha/beta fold hydrolase [Brasilonema sp. UFV-L1]|uniref:alpha/beta hydrolase n=1 Tax=Brasilonema sp. UFV-L1 TaxID=2234130 RepID=UPI00145D8433|nr:alpha/beta fold hydrolase [Brasilonema sp. UFV-L1]NMG06103.1 phospholipase [Brasilonema sp. UFV-L1]